jgi:hypothetical protein
MFRFSSHKIFGPITSNLSKIALLSTTSILSCERYTKPIVDNSLQTYKKDFFLSNDKLLYIREYGKYLPLDIIIEYSNDDYILSLSSDYITSQLFIDSDYYECFNITFTKEMMTGQSETDYHHIIMKNLLLCCLHITKHKDNYVKEGYKSAFMMRTIYNDMQEHNVSINDFENIIIQIFEYIYENYDAHYLFNFACNSGTFGGIYIKYKKKNLTTSKKMFIKDKKEKNAIITEWYISK